MLTQLSEISIDTFPFLTLEQLKQLDTEKTKIKERSLKRKLELKELSTQRDAQLQTACRDVNEEEKKLQMKLKEIQNKKAKISQPILEEFKNKKISIQKEMNAGRDRKSSKFAYQFERFFKFMSLLQESEHPEKWIAIWEHELAMTDEDGNKLLLWETNLPVEVEREIGHVKILMKSQVLPSNITDSFDMRHYDEYKWSVNLDKCTIQAFNKSFKYSDRDKKEIDWKLIDDDRPETENEVLCDEDQVNRDKLEMECGDWDDPRYAVYEYVKKGAILFFKLKTTKP